MKLSGSSKPKPGLNAGDSGAIRIRSRPGSSENSSGSEKYRPPRCKTQEDKEQIRWQRSDPKEITSFEELIMSTLYIQEVLVNLLDQKGLLKKEEIIEEIRRLRQQTRRAASGSGGP
jgi:hypothetical protein